MSIVKQGENLSPVLFFLFINDLVMSSCDVIDIEYSDEKTFVFLKFLILTDGTAISAEDELHFQRNLDNFLEYCKIWKLNINNYYSKTKVLVWC